MRQEDVDSDYHFDNCLQLPPFVRLRAKSVAILWQYHLGHGFTAQFVLPHFHLRTCDTASWADSSLSEHLIDVLEKCREQLIVVGEPS